MKFKYHFSNILITSISGLYGAVLGSTISNIDRIPILSIIISLIGFILIIYFSLQFSIEESYSQLRAKSAIQDKLNKLFSFKPCILKSVVILIGIGLLINPFWIDIFGIDRIRYDKTSTHTKISYVSNDSIKIIGLTGNNISNLHNLNILRYYREKSGIRNVELVKDPPILLKNNSAIWNLKKNIDQKDFRIIITALDSINFFVVNDTVLFDK